MPPLAPGNIAAWEVWKRVGDQWNVAPMGGVLSIKQEAIWPVMDALEVVDRLETFDRVRIIADEHLAVWNEE